MFPCEGLRATWQGYVEPGYCNNCAIRLASDLGLFGLSENEAKDKLFEWNERNGIKLPSDEVRNVVRSAYQRRRFVADIAEPSAVTMLLAIGQTERFAVLQSRWL